MKASLRPLRLFVAAAAILSLAAFVFATPAAATHGQPGKQLPLRAMAAYTSSGVDFAPGFPEERSTFGGRCSVPSDYVISWDGVANWSHLGMSTVVEGSHCSQWDLAAGSITFGDGEGTFMASDSDTMYITYGNGAGSFQPDGTFPYTFEITITGGTGRFAGATGQVAASGEIVFFDMTVMPWAFTVVEEYDGWIDYDASQNNGP